MDYIQEHPPPTYTAYHMGLRRFPYRKLQDITEQSPSRQHGITAEREHTMLRTATNMIIGAGQKLQMDHLAIATAVTCLRRYYSIKSLLKNDYFVISIACLYLGGKVEDSPKSIKDVLYACFEWRFKGQPELLQRLYDREFYDSAKERVFTAERALMYALRFDFNISHPYQPFFDIFRDSPVSAMRAKLAETDSEKAKSMGQLAMSLVNDSIKTPLCLQYDGVQIGVAVVWLVLQLYHMDADVIDEQTGKVWWERYMLTPHILQDVATQILSLYDLEQQQPAPGEQQHLGSAQDVLQGVQDGELLLYSSSTMTQEQFQRSAGRRQQQQAPSQVQPAASAHGATVLGKEAASQHVRLATTNAGQKYDDDDDEYSELFATTKS